MAACISDRFPGQEWRGFTALDPVLPQLRIVVDRLLIPVVLAVVGDIEAGAAEVAHVADLVPLEAAGV